MSETKRMRITLEDGTVVDFEGKLTKDKASGGAFDVFAQVETVTLPVKAFQEAAHRIEELEHHNQLLRAVVKRAELAGSYDKYGNWNYLLDEARQAAIDGGALEGEEVNDDSN